MPFLLLRYLEHSKKTNTQTHTNDVPKVKWKKNEQFLLTGGHNSA